MATAALSVPRCQCARPLHDLEGNLCCRCGREIRLLGTLGRAWRKAAYDRELRRARGEGLDPTSGFLGLSDELGPNPEVELLRDALEERVGYERARGGPSTAPL
jgi:hypothetical protein